MSKYKFIKTILVAIVLVFTFAFVQCKKKECVTENLGEIHFTQNELNIVPYNGTETLIFKDSINDSIIFTGKMRYSDSFNIWEFPNDYECLGKYYNTESNYTKFEGVNSTKIYIYLYMGSPFLQDFIKKMNIEIFINSDTCYFYGTLAFNPTNIFNTIPAENNLPANAYVLAFNSSLSIGPNIFNNVYTLKQIDPPHLPSKNLQYVYYTISDGVVGFKTEEGHLWYLENL